MPVHRLGCDRRLPVELANDDRDEVGHDPKALAAMAATKSTNLFVHVCVPMCEGGTGPAAGGCRLV